MTLPFVEDWSPVSCTHSICGEVWCSDQVSLSGCHSPVPVQTDSWTEHTSSPPDPAESLCEPVHRVRGFRGNRECGSNRKYFRWDKYTALNSKVQFITVKSTISLGTRTCQNSKWNKCLYNRYFSVLALAIRYKVIVCARYHSAITKPFSYTARGCINPQLRSWPVLWGGRRSDRTQRRCTWPLVCGQWRKSSSQGLPGSVVLPSQSIAI